MTKYTFIGDVHGKFVDYYWLCERAPGPTIQVGDLGVGFSKEEGRRYGPYYRPYTMPALHHATPQHRFIRGNHDNPNVCRGHPLWIRDGAEIDSKVFALGGARSIDRDQRVEGRDWWADEELSDAELDAAIETWRRSACGIIVSHDAPTEIARSIWPWVQKSSIPPSRTQQALQRLLHARPPKLWLFGHWHERADVVIGGTRFVCLDELQALTLDL